MGALRLMLGPPAALEAALHDAVAAARAADPLAPVTVLCGSTLLKPYLARTLAASGLPLINVRFAMADELAASLSSAPADARPRLTPAAEQLLIREIAESATGYFAGVAAGDGFAKALKTLFRELDRGGFASEERFARAVAAAGFTRHPKLEALSAMYTGYLERRSGFRTPVEELARADTTAFEGPLLIYGLWQAAELTLALIERAAQTHDVTAFIPQPDSDADPESDPLRERLLTLGAHETRLRREPEQPVEQLSSRLFARDGAADPIEASGISMASAADTVREVWEAARRCLDWAREGIACHEIAVVYRNADPYAALIDEIFAEARIETYLHDGRPLAAHPLGRRLLALLDLAASGDFSRRAVMEFLTETKLPATTAARYGESTSEWESFTRQAGIVAGINQWQRRLDRLAAERRERANMEGFEWMADVAVRIEAPRAFATDLHEALAARPDAATWEEHLTYVRSLVERYCPDAMPLVDALGELTVLTAVTARASFATFFRAVRDDLEDRDASRVLGEPIRAFGRHGVAVLDAASVRQLRFRAVCLVGVAERAWPPPPRPDPLLLEHERAALNAARLGELPLRTEPDDEPLTFYLAVSAARERLMISYARAEAGGSGRHLPSHFFRAAAEVLAGHPLGLDELDASGVVRRFEAGRLASDDRGASLTPAEYDRGLVCAMIAGDEPAARAALTELSPAFGRATQAHRARRGAQLTPYDGVLASPEDLAHTAAPGFARERPVSPSRLEMYATCPYRYFMRYTLGIGPADEPEAVERIDSLERGSLIHAILERFLKDCGRDDPPRPDARDRHLAQLHAAAQTEYREREERGVTGLPLIWAMDRQRIGDDLVRWYDEEVGAASASDFLPGDFEVGFGGAGFAMGPQGTLSSEAPFALDVAGRRLLLQGRIDRIDWDDAKTKFRVIDYKTGRRRDGNTAFDGGRALQLPLYLRAAAELLDIDPLNGEAQYFYVTRTGGYHRDTLTGAELAARTTDFERVLETIATGADRGYFAPNPGKGRENCTYCDYRHICDARIDRVMDRKAGDPRGDEYRALGEIP